MKRPERIDKIVQRALDMSLLRPDEITTVAEFEDALTRLRQAQYEDVSQRGYADAYVFYVPIAYWVEIQKESFARSSAPFFTLSGSSAIKSWLNPYDGEPCSIDFVPPRIPGERPRCRVTLPEIRGPQVWRAE